MNDVKAEQGRLGPFPTETGAQADALRCALESALGAQYSVLQLLGRGGMGAVYLAKERLLERLVAIKVLPSERADGEARERFLREARTAAALSHSGIVPLLSFGEQGDTLFFIMKYVEGESLESRLRREGTLPHADTRRILSELCDALSHAHAQGIVHRDIKPDNVLIERDTGRVMLADFGVARHRSATSTLTGTGMIVGTPQYMSPEQASGERDIDGRSDLYGLGVMGYRMLAGRLPFVGDSTRELLVQHITEAPRPVSEVAADAPVDLTAAVMKCLAKAPADRWSDAASLRHAISTAADDVVMPDELEGLPRLGTRIAAWGYVFFLSMLFIRLFDADPVWLRMGVFGPALGLVFGLGSQLFEASRHRIAWRRLLQLAFWPPVGWSGWWPERLRPPGDLWTRLPGTVRRARIAGITTLTVLFGGVTLPALLVLLIWNQQIRLWSPLAQEIFVNTWILSSLAPVVSLLPAYLALARFGRQRGLTKAEANRLLAEPTVNSRFWDRPSISRLLDAPQPSSKTPSTEGELVAQVRAIAAALAPDMKALAAEAVNAADELLSAIQSLDRQRAELSDPADADERHRCELRLGALGAPREEEPESRRQMRALLEGQLALLRDMEGRRDALVRRRGLLYEHLKTLWMQMVHLGAQVAVPSPDATALSDRIRAICRDIAHRTQAVEETERLIGS